MKPLSHAIAGGNGLTLQHVRPGTARILKPQSLTDILVHVTDRDQQVLQAGCKSN